MAAPIDNCICVIQARRGSSRLPDKVLMPICGMPALYWVIKRCQRIEGVDKVVCAIPEGTYNDPLAEIALANGAFVVRGSEDDVLSRFAKALEAHPSRYVMRVTSDCPLIDPEVCGVLLSQLQDSSREYGATAWWPHGLDCEVMNADLLRQADVSAQNSHDREHVTLWIKRNVGGELISYRPEKDYSRVHRWTLDYPEDWQFLSTLCKRVKGSLELVRWHELLELVKEDSSLLDINRAHIERWQVRTQEIYQKAAR